MNTAEIRQSLAAAASAVTGLNTAAWLTNSVAAPMFAVGDCTFDYLQVVKRGGLTKLTFTCWVLVGTGNDIDSQATLDDYLNPLGDTSVPNALMADQTLGGSAATCVVRDVRTVITPVAGNDYYGAQFTVEVYA